MRTFAKQNGLTLSGFIVVAILFIFVAILGMKLIPAYIENGKIQKAFESIVRDSAMQAATVAEIKESFVKRAIIIDGVTSVTQNDILIAVNVNANIPYQLPVRKPEHTDMEKNYGKMRAALNEKWAGVIDHYIEKYMNGKSPKPKPANMFDIISESIILAQNKAAKIYIEKYKPDILIETSVDTASTFDFYKSEELIEAGRMACRKALDAIEQRS